MERAMSAQAAPSTTVTVRVCDATTIVICFRHVSTRQGLNVERLDRPGLHKASKMAESQDK